MRGPLVPRALRAVVSAGLSIALVVGATHVRHVNHTTVALALVLLTLGISMRWGWLEALTASFAGGLGFDYFFLSSRGFGLEAPEHLVTLAAFLLTAVITGQLSAHTARTRAEAERRREEMAKLYRLGNDLLESDSADGLVERIADEITEIFQARSAAFFDEQRNRTIRSGAAQDCISDDALRKVAASGTPVIESFGKRCVVPIRVGARLTGSLGIAGISLTRASADAVAERVGVSLVRAYAAQESLAAELARRSENLKSAVLDALAHEIKGPLATVKVSVSALLSRQPGNALQQRELLAIIDEESDRIERWIDNAIQVSRSQAGQLRLERKPNSIGQAVQRALQGLGPLASDRRIEVSIPESLPVAVFDSDMIEKVIRLVLDNALKYSPRDSPIAIHSEFTGAEIVVSIEDHGFGIPENEREKIFESYYRGSTVRQGTPGTGLGLASCRCMMQAHGGEIWVTSAAGVGSVFHISLPATEEVFSERAQSLERG